MKKNTPLTRLGKLDRERKLKEIAGEDGEKLEAMGQESDRKAAKWVIEEGEKSRHEESEAAAETEWKLSDAKGKTITYKGLLLKELRRLMTNWEDELPEGWKWVAVGTKKGLVIWLRDPSREWYARGVQVSGLPKYDLNGIFKLIMRALTFAKPYENEKKSGILLPN